MKSFCFSVRILFSILSSSTYHSYDLLPFIRQVDPVNLPQQQGLVFPAKPFHHKGEKFSQPSGPPHVIFRRVRGSPMSGASGPIPCPPFFVTNLLLSESSPSRTKCSCQDGPSRRNRGAGDILPVSAACPSLSVRFSLPEIILHPRSDLFFELIINRKLLDPLKERGEFDHPAYDGL